MAMDITVRTYGPELDSAAPLADLVRSDLEAGHRLRIDRRRVVLEAGVVVWEETRLPACLDVVQRWTLELCEWCPPSPPMDVDGVTGGQG